MIRNRLLKYSLGLAGWLCAGGASAQQVAWARPLPAPHYEQAEEARITLDEALSQIEKRFEVHVLYRIDDVARKQVLRTHLQGETAETQLQRVLQPHGLVFRKLSKNNYAVIVREAPERPAPTGLTIPGADLPLPLPTARQLTASLQSLRPAPQVPVAGRIVDEKGAGIPGVNIIEKGTQNGTISDVEGRFALNVNGGSTLVFSAVGFATQEQVVGDRAVLNVTLVEDVSTLSEVVVIGYGSGSVKTWSARSVR